MNGWRTTLQAVVQSRAKKSPQIRTKDFDALRLYGSLARNRATAFSVAFGKLLISGAPVSKGFRTRMF